VHTYCHSRSDGRLVVAILGSLLTFVAGGGCDGTPAGGTSHSGPRHVVVETVVLEPSSVPHLLPALGTLESPQMTALASEVSGVVTFLDIPEGTEVEKGRVLARVDSRQAQAQLSVAQSRYKNARETFERVEALQADGLISRQELDDAAAKLDQEAGALEESRTSLTQTEIRAPFTGQLGLRQVSLGAFVTAGQALVRLTQTDPLRLVFSVPERDAGSVRRGQKIRGIAGDCTQLFETEVGVIDPSIDAATRTVRVQATVGNPQRRLRAGMSARLALEIGRSEDALAVPQEAVIRRGTRKLLFILKPDGEFEERKIVLGQHFPDRIEVLSGVTAGETVVVAGQQRLAPGVVADPRPYEPIHNPKLALGFPHLPACAL